MYYNLHFTRGDKALKRCSNLSKITQLVNNKIGIQTQILTQVHFFIIIIIMILHYFPFWCLNIYKY